MGRSGLVSRAETLRLMRHLADVAALVGDPPAQRQLLADGLNTLFRTSVGWMFAFDDVRPGWKMRPAMTVMAGDHHPVWHRYCADFVRHVPAGGDFYADAATRCPDQEQQWRRGHLLSSPADYRRYTAAVQLVRETGLGEGAVCIWRCGPGLHRIAGFSLHRFEHDPRLSERDYSLHRLALSEIRRMSERGTLRFVDDPQPELPPRLRQVLAGMLDGQSPKQVALGLGLSLWTVREHIQRLYVHFGINTREELMAKFIDRDRVS